MKYSVLYSIRILAICSSFTSTTCRNTSIESVKIYPNPKLLKGHMILSDRRFLQKSLQLQQTREKNLPFYLPFRIKFIPAETYSCHCSYPVLSQAFVVANWGFPDAVSGLKQTTQHSDVDFNQTHVCGSVKPLGFHP